MQAIASDRPGDDVATAVLADRALFRRIAAFQSGYPETVSTMVRAASTSEIEDALKTTWRNSYKYYNRQLFGVLPRLAVVTGDFETLRLLHKLSSQPQYRYDPKPKFVGVMRTAVTCQNVDMLDCLAELKEHDPQQQWERDLISHAVSVNEGEPRVLEWLYQHLPSKYRQLRGNDMTAAVNRRDIESVRWLLEHGCSVPTYAVDCAAFGGSVEVLAYLHDHSTVRCSAHEFVRVAESGDLEIVKLVAVDQPVETYEWAINVAAERGRLDVVQFFVESSIGVNSATVIDEAARSGHLSVVKYLHEHIAGGCTTKAMDNAAKFGHMDVFRFLHENRSEGCTTSAMDEAASNGQLDIVKFLHENRLEGCTTKAMTDAAAHGHLDVVRFLHENRKEGCTSRALKMAAANNHLDVVEFLCQRRLESDIPFAMISAASIGNLDAIRILHKHLRSHDSAYPVVRAAAQWQNADILRFLCGNQSVESGVPSFLMQAVEDRNLRVVRAVLPFASLADVQQAIALANKLERESEMIRAMGTRAEELTRVQVVSV